MMSADEIPEACLNDPQFKHNLVVTICSEITKQQKIISDGLEAVNELKEKLAAILARRKMLKGMIEVEKTNASLLEPTFDSSNRLVNEKTTQFALISAQLDEQSLREKADIESFRNIVQMYKTLMETRQSEYLAMIPLAAERHRTKVKLQLFEVMKMLLTQKTEEMKKTQEQKRKIDERRFQVAIVELLTIVLKRFKMQKNLKSMNDGNLELSEKLTALKRQKERLMKQKEEEEREKLRARQLMPPPKLDMSMLKTFCSTSSTEQQILGEEEICASSDGDNLSINTAILEDMCRDEDQCLMDVTDDEEIYELPRSQALARSITMVMKNQSLESREIDENPENIEVLERSCSQLSLEEEDDNPTANDLPINSPIEVQVIVESQKSRDSPILRKPSSILKAQSILRKPKEIGKNSEGPSEEKRAKIDDKKSREIPKIQSVETITRPVTVTTKPLVAEVTPTLTNLFSPRHYAPSSCASIDDLDSEFDTNIEDAPKQPNQMNWANFSPLQGAASENSFTSDISAFKPGPGNDDPSTNTETNFFSVFNKGSKGRSGFLFNN